MKKNRNLHYIILLIAVTLTSCEKVIQLDLNTINPQLVIQGDIYDEPGPYVINISKTVNFDQPNVFPPVTNATVTITDNKGQSEELSQATPGNYVTSTLKGIIGRTYTLKVTIDEKTYTSVSTMPEPVEIDTIYQKKSVFGGNLIALSLTNPPNKDNYYQVIHLVNGKQVPGFSVFADNSAEFESISYSFMSTSAVPPLVAGDSINVWLECIDNGVFEYFRTANKDGGRSASPSNPVSNITNGALGYFNACSVRKKVFIYPEDKHITTTIN